MILKMLRIGNPYLHTANWKIAKLEEPKNDYRSAIIIINKESLKGLAKTDGLVNTIKPIIHRGYKHEHTADM